MCGPAVPQSILVFRHLDFRRTACCRMSAPKPLEPACRSAGGQSEPLLQLVYATTWRADGRAELLFRQHRRPDADSHAGESASPSDASPER